MTGSPFAELRQGVLRLRFLDTDPIRSFNVRCVLDLTDFGDVVGVEVLDLAEQLDGGAMAPQRWNGDISWSYDAEMDALYIHIRKGQGHLQKSGLATAQLDPAGHVVDLAIPVPAMA